MQLDRLKDNYHRGIHTSPRLKKISKRERENERERVGWGREEDREEGKKKQKDRET